MSQREPGLDLLRCLALLFVVSFHGFLYNGYAYAPQTGTAMWLAGSFRWLSTSCIGIFLMLTGYLKSHYRGLRACCRSLLPVILGYLLASAISVPVRHFLLGDVQTPLVWIGRLLSFRAVYYGWYVEMYIGLMLLIPFGNILLEKLTDKELCGLVFVLLFLTALPGITTVQVFPDYWRQAYPLTYYILGAAIKRMQPKANLWVCLAAAVSISLILGAVTVLSTNGDLRAARTWEFADLWICGITVCLFLALYRIRACPAAERLLAFGAGGCYGGYLLSHLLDAWCYSRFPRWHAPEQYPKLFVAVTIPIFLVSILAGRLLQKGTARLVPHKGGIDHAE